MRKPTQIPKRPPRVEQTMPEMDIRSPSHSWGTAPPTADPTTAPIQMRLFTQAASLSGGRERKQCGAGAVEIADAPVARLGLRQRREHVRPLGRERLPRRHHAERELGGDIELTLRDGERGVEQQLLGHRLEPE